MMLMQAQAGRWARQLTILALASPLLFACESYSLGSHSLTDKPLNAADKTSTAMFSAAMTPLEDIGLRKRQIPEMLKMLAENPYTPPATIACDDLKKEMADLNVLLGPDYDAPKIALSAREEAMETGGNLLQDAVVGLVRSQADVVPFRSIVRRLTGASSHEKKVNRALEAGKLRRAYLRGMADAKFGTLCIPKPQVITATADEKSIVEGLAFFDK